MFRQVIGHQTVLRNTDIFCTGGRINISTPLMFHLFTFTNAISDMNFMLQKEVVNRLVAGPGSKTYGRLSVMAQYYCQVVPVLDVPPTAFRPAPKVDSAVVRLIPHRENPYVLKDVALLSRVTTQAFNQRRKTIRNSLGDLFSPETLTELGIDPNTRSGWPRSCASAVKSTVMASC